MTVQPKEGFGKEYPKKLRRCDRNRKRGRGKNNKAKESFSTQKK